MKNSTIDGSNSRIDCCRGHMVKDTTHPSEYPNGPTDRRSKTMCKCCGKEGADAMASTEVFVVIGMNAASVDLADWVVAIFENKQAAIDHMAAAQAAADKLFTDYENGLIEDANLDSLENQYDPHFRFEPEGVRYELEEHALFKARQGLEAVKKWAAEY